MLNILFAFLLFMHGLVHFVGLSKAINYASIPQLTKHISRTEGIFWLATAVLFLVTCMLFLVNKDSWLITGAVAVVVSEILIINTWKDARFGTFANLVVLVVTISSIVKLFNK